MVEIAFYHLTRSRLEHELPKLLARTLDAGQRAFVLCRNQASVAALDKALWDAPEPAWLPHGTAADGDAELQPIWLGMEATAPNGAKYLFLVDGAVPPSFGAFDRIFDLFDGNDENAVAAARLRWKNTRDAGHTLTYWQQGPHRWQKKA